MAKIEDCPGFETFGADVKEARKAKNLARKDLAEKVNIDTRYLANIENEGTIPSLPVIIQLVKICGLPMERYFNTLKTELIYQHNYRTETELYSAIEEFAYVHYNHVRPHSYNNYKTPFETRYGRYKPDTKI